MDRGDTIKENGKDYRALQPHLGTPSNNSTLMSGKNGEDESSSPTHTPPMIEVLISFPYQPLLFGGNKNIWTFILICKLKTYASNLEIQKRNITKRTRGKIYAHRVSNYTNSMRKMWFSLKLKSPRKVFTYIFIDIYF